MAHARAFTKLQTRTKLGTNASFLPEESIDQRQIEKAPDCNRTLPKLVISSS
jgi:hypothetical protein